MNTSPEHQAFERQIIEAASPLFGHIPVEVRDLPPQVEPIAFREYIDDQVIRDLDHVVRTHGNEALVDQWEYHRPEAWPNGNGRSCVGCYDDWRFTGLAQAHWPCPAIEAALLVAGIEIPEALR